MEYTSNIDDCVENTPRRDRAQRLYTINRNDRPTSSRTFEQVEVVHLNGFIKSAAAGFIFSPQQYRREIRQGSPWYKRCAENFIDKIFLFIGTELNEPIFDAFVEDLPRGTSSLRSARSFLIKPSGVSERKQRLLADKRIACVKGSLSDLVAFLRTNLPHGVKPAELSRTDLGGAPCSRRQD